MTALGIPRVQLFPFPTPPPDSAVRTARELLISIGAIEHIPAARQNNHHISSTAAAGADVCTRLGERIAQLPIPPRYARMLFSAIAKGRSAGNCTSSYLASSCLLISALSLTDLVEIVHEEEMKKDQSIEKPLLFWKSFSNDVDALVWLTGAFAHAQDKHRFCSEYKANHRQMCEMECLATQLARILTTRIKCSQQTLSRHYNEMCCVCAAISTLKCPCSHFRHPNCRPCSFKKL
eukprot:GHVS01054579.1.p1 GENE.GHVS01054579.1~~GHVS01054579.1.p1  ORF type:complete len:251 (+),score=28.10 GHVS01054579.1:49-753(+)